MRLSNDYVSHLDKIAFGELCLSLFKEDATMHERIYARYFDDPKISNFPQFNDGEKPILSYSDGQIQFSMYENELYLYSFEPNRPNRLRNRNVYRYDVRNFSESQFLYIWHCCWFNLTQIETLSTLELCRLTGKRFSSLYHHVCDSLNISTSVEKEIVGLNSRISTNIPADINAGKERYPFEDIADSMDEITKEASSSYQFGSSVNFPFRSNGRAVQVVDVSPMVIDWLGNDPNRLLGLLPHQFENLIANRFDDMGFDVQQVSPTYRPDGGIDLIVTPRKFVVPFTFAIQVKHHGSTKGKTDVGEVREFEGAIKELPINIGMIVTNTEFTASAKWFVDNKTKIIQLKDLGHIAKWLVQEYLQEFDPGVLPEEVVIGQGITIKIPRVTRSLDNSDPSLN